MEGVVCETIETLRYPPLDGADISSPKREYIMDFTCSKNDW